MARLRLRPGKAFLLCGLTLLASCAAKPGVPAPAMRTAIPPGSLTTGVIVAIRPASLPSPLPQSSAQVLAALQLQAPVQSPNATEFVIRRSDGNAASIVLPTPASNPDATLSAADFAIGDQVELLTGVKTELLHRVP